MEIFVYTAATYFWTLIHLWSKTEDIWCYLKCVFLGRLRVDLITYMGRKMSVRTSIRTQKVSSDFNEIWCVGRGRWVMHDGMQYDPSKVKVMSPWKSENRPFSKAISFPNYDGGWQMITDSLIRGKYLKLIGSVFLNFVPVSMSLDFEVGSN